MADVIVVREGHPRIHSTKAKELHHVFVTFLCHERDEVVSSTREASSGILGLGRVVYMY